MPRRRCALIDRAPISNLATHNFLGESWANPPPSYANRPARSQAPAQWFLTSEHGADTGHPLPGLGIRTNTRRPPAARPPPYTPYYFRVLAFNHAGDAECTRP